MFGLEQNVRNLDLIVSLTPVSKSRKTDFRSYLSLPSPSTRTRVNNKDIKIPDSVPDYK